MSFWRNFPRSCIKYKTRPDTGARSQPLCRCESAAGGRGNLKVVGDNMLVM